MLLYERQITKGINLNAQPLNEMTHFDLALNVRLLDTLEYISVLLSSRDTTVNGVLCWLLTER